MRRAGTMAAPTAATTDSGSHTENQRRDGPGTRKQLESQVLG